MSSVVTVVSSWTRSAGSPMRRWNSGSFSSSTPRLKLQVAAAITPTIPAGSVILTMSKIVMAAPILDE